MFNLIRRTSGQIGVLERLAFNRSDPVSLYLGWVGFGNLGDEALSEVFRRKISPRKMLTTYAPPWWTAGASSRICDRADVSALVLGGGTLIGRAPWVERLGRLSQIFPKAQIWSVGVGVEDPVSLAGGSVEIWRREIDLLLELMPNFANLTVRGPASQAILGGLGLDVPWSGDPALLLGTADVNTTPDERTLLVSVGAVDGVVGSSIHAVIAELEHAASVLARDGWRITVMPVNPRDFRQAKELAKSISHHGVVRLSPIVTSWEVFQSEARKHQVGIHLRLHPAILAAGAFAPYIQISHLPKCADFQATITPAGRAIDARFLSGDDLVHQVLDIADRFEHEQTQLVKAVTLARQRLDGDFSHVASILRTSSY